MLPLGNLSTMRKISCQQDLTFFAKWRQNILGASIYLKLVLWKQKYIPGWYGDCHIVSLHADRISSISSTSLSVIYAPIIYSEYRVWRIYIIRVTFRICCIFNQILNYFLFLATLNDIHLSELAYNPKYLSWSLLYGIMQWLSWLPISPPKCMLLEAPPRGVSH